MPRGVAARAGGVALLLLSLAVPSRLSADPAPPLKLRLAHVLPESHPFHLAARRFATELKRLSGGSLDVEIFADGSIGDERELLESLQMGAVDFIAATASMTAKFDGDFHVFSLPFLVGSLEHELRAIDDPAVRGSLEPGLIDRHIRPIGWWAGGPREYYGTARVRTLADFAGLRVRTIEDPYVVATWAALGAVPTPLSFASIEPALRGKLVDGAEGTLEVYVAKRFDRSAPEVSLLHTSYLIELLQMSEATWQRLTPRQRGWVTEAARLSSAYERTLVEERERALPSQLAALHVHVTRPPPAPLRAAVQQLYARFHDERGDEGWKVVELIRRLGAPD